METVCLVALILAKDTSYHSINYITRLTQINKILKAGFRPHCII